ncbi:LmbE family N-acetylglucosaminyl deacetylase [Asanoa ferruginea]|uniref:LmbE family N-acetylglucosaminyl deacetylase n=1 Tax=Asanoa ferruginea TaxID=53367 RepID=A0A3D9ZW43_9ACTN|nr:PIG-L family deacetylase [Asanoa ferruginea]REG00835.1 LmbE family N-acetylglucosaminyl deacetylase [Asanoa ferruginea]GIF47290.1 GlcNAc-PI de-N-acetylase [Asanoa ferruginea]
MNSVDERRFTVVAFHAHPDDEALLTGGTLARIVAEGHRVVLVVATLGQAGLAAGPGGDALAARRRGELLTSASILGCARVVTLDYLDSGLHDESAPQRFAAVAVEVAAARLAEILRIEHADVLTTYDARGGYGHPDHVQVHRVGALAARLAGTPVVLEATVDRRSLRPLLAALRVAGRLLPRLPLLGARTAFTAHAEITHMVDVRPFLRRKRAALRAHTSQTEGGRGLRTIAVLSRLPGPVFAAVAGHEWYVEPGRRPGEPFADDIFASLR